MTDIRKLGGDIPRRPLHLIWLVDCSGSMANDDKIESLNFAMRDGIPFVREAMTDNPAAQLLVRVVSFADNAAWQTEEPTPIESFGWMDLQAGGVRSTGAALRIVAEALDIRRMPERGLPPILVLVSDGAPTDDFDQALEDLNQQPWAKRASRIAIALRDDADRDYLQKFIDLDESHPITAEDSEVLRKQIRSILKIASRDSWARSDARKFAAMKAVARAPVIPAPPQIPQAFGDGAPGDQNDVF